MADISQTNATHTNDTAFTVHPSHVALAQNDIITPGSGKSVSNQTDRCPFPGCRIKFPHQHSTANGETAPSIKEHHKANQAIRPQWTEEQRRRIMKNEVALSQLPEGKPDLGKLTVETHLPRGTGPAIKEQVATNHGRVAPSQCDITREMHLAQLRQDIIDNTSPISPPSSPSLGVLKTETQSHEDLNLMDIDEWNDFPELDAKYGTTPGSSKSPNPAVKAEPEDDIKAFHNNSDNLNPASNSISAKHMPYKNTDFSDANSSLCTGPCPIQTPHSQGAYLHQGQIPRTWNMRWGYSEPPQEIWESWIRIELGHGSSWDRVQVDGFALSHWWAGP